MFLEIEAGLVLAALVLAFWAPNIGSRWFEAVERSFGKLAKRQGLSVVVVGLSALVLRAALLPILPIPQPAGMDGFAYRLLADTFAHGRLTNPTNPMWVHFETFNVIWHPTYTAKFWPAQGLIMALGQVLTGQPYWGVWLSAGLMCAAIIWMLQGWLTPAWALLGGFLAVIRFGTFSYWADSYWGGAVAAIGGALVLGALPRMKQQKRVRYALWMGLGFAIIANSRPYEGLFFGIPVAVVLFLWLWRLKRPDLMRVLKYVMAPLLAALALTLVAMGYYFWRTTGSPFKTPYLTYEDTYDPAPNFPWQSLKRLPAYHHKTFEDFYVKELSVPQYERTRTLRGFITVKGEAAIYFWSFFLGPVLALPFFLLVTVALPYGFSLKDIGDDTRFLLLVCCVTLAGEALPIWYFPHYSAPLTAAILALVLIALRRLRTWQWRGKPAGMFVTRIIPSICLFLFMLRVVAGITRWPRVSKFPEGVFPTWCSLSPMNLSRATTLARLDQYPGRQLVIVHYGSGHDVNYNEWVYNRADLRSAKVIWAHDMGPAKNQELIDYFKHRHVWLVDADANPPKLIPYPVAGGGS